MEKRYIRLKELKPNLLRNYIPNEKYLSSTNGLQDNEVYPLKTDSFGNQVSNLERESLNDIYLLGASTIESIYIRPSARPHNYLEYLLLKSGYDYSVFNLGVSGAHTLSIINVIINKLGDKKGSTLIITLPSNDLSILSFEKNYFNSHQRFASIVPASDKRLTYRPVLDYKPYIKNLEIIASICRILELNLIFTTVVYTGVDENLSKLNSLAIEFCKSNNIKIIDFKNKFIDSSNLFYDKLHFLPKGSEVYAKTIFESVKNNLISRGIDIIETHELTSKTTLNKKMIWSDFFKVEGYHFIRVIVDAEFASDSDVKQALMSVDYDVSPITTNLIKSPNNEIGFFSYITGQKNKRMEVLLHIDIPSNCSRVRIGLREWSSQKVKIHKSFITIVKV
ncbi:SGNH/GDSL hydrolase family protein [Psychrobacter sp. FBL11]|uniref:SGNH/GDSL hydrolase family protein n=1 Tax=Psychrobacter saeujeotis TaxID=3143436 RepID=A0ABU9X8W8_9GAMM|nr:SGNH/GDSL hydrolase family protein [uncultured Psychrobacter sp.]